MSSQNYAPVRAIVVMPASSADETLGMPQDATGRNFHTFYVTGAGTVSTGVLTFEEAPSVDWAGTWSSIATIDVAVTSFASSATVAAHLPEANYGAVRCRISTAIAGGGTLTVRYTAN